MDYQGNSKKQKEGTKDNKDASKKDLEKVVSGEVIVKPPTIGSKFKSIFFGGDVTTASHYVVSEVLLPALRNLIVESISKGADRLIYGDSIHRRRTPSYQPRVQYNNPIYRQGGVQQRQAMLPNQSPLEKWSQSRKPFQDVIVASKEDADTVVERMIDCVDMYEVVSVADLYELLGLPSSHVDQKWGWTHLVGMDVRQVREGYQITFPPLEEIS